MLAEVDRKVFQKLGVGLTCEPVKKQRGNYRKFSQ